jgi:hypothetical protein
VEERVDGGRVREVDHHVLGANVAVLEHVYMISGTTNFRLIILMKNIRYMFTSLRN